MRAARHPGLHPDRQWHGLHDPPLRRPGRPQRSRARAAPRRLGIKQKNGKPDHPQPPGKAERFQQTMKNWLHAQPAQPATLADLQSLLDAFARICSNQRPHRSLTGRATPAVACAARPKASPGLVTLRHNGKLHHIGTGRAHAGIRVLLLVQDLHIRVINAGTGELIRELILNPDRDCQPTGKRQGRPKKHREPHVGSRCP
jgi:hypothetical protein